MLIQGVPCHKVAQLSNVAQCLVQTGVFRHVHRFTQLHHGRVQVLAQCFRLAGQLGLERVQILFRRHVFDNGRHQPSINQCLHWIACQGILQPQYLTVHLWQITPTKTCVHLQLQLAQGIVVALVIVRRTPPHLMMLRHIGP